MKTNPNDAVAAEGGLGSTGVPPVPVGVPPGGPRGARTQGWANATRLVGDSAGRRAEQAGRLCYPSRGSAQLVGVALFALLLGPAAYAQEKQSAVSGVSGVKQDAVDRIKPVTQAPPPTAVEVKPVTQTPPPTSVEVKPVTQTPPPPPPPTAVEVKPVTQTPPPPPPPTAVEVKPVTQTPPPPTGVDIKPVTQAPPPPPPPVNKIEGVHTPPPPPPPVSVVKQAGTIQAVNGVTGLNTAKLKNLEAALILKQAAEAPKGDDAEHSGKGKAAAAALLGAPLDKPAPKPPKEDGRGALREFEKLQSRGS